ncbi:MAG: bifunctional 5,10-methylenetetrahydrofolate dehydrogenase/5,10-methenyltetrahydrofolate cyclohydrolase [Eubacteriaceae bacterium]|nr:bifunctional 5,10-methylenetetrahydrofolate dehydrogenase/5,10-methenyltetrahydrofolate cyclohydrolase [Eubacteriaceae bacterium]
MAAKILSGNEVSESILADVTNQSNELREKGIVPTLAVFRVGDDPGSLSYEKSIIKRMAATNIEVITYEFAMDVTQEDFILKIREANADSSVHGILIFKPLPEQLDEEEIKYALSPEKDPDAMNPTNLGKLMISDDKGFYPCTPEGVMELFKFYEIDVKGKDITIINNSNVFGKPLAMMLTDQFATVSITHVFTKDVQSYTLNSDIVITAAGIYGLVKPEQLREDCILIDVAMAQMRDENREFVLDENGKKIRTGDAHIDCKDKVAMITSATPGCGGGTGPITTALLGKHVIKGCKLQNGIQ